MRGKSAMSQQWFVSVDNWVAGTAADVQAAPAFFDIEVCLHHLCIPLQGLLCIGQARAWLISLEQFEQIEPSQHSRAT